MSTLTQAQPGTAVPGRLLIPALAVAAAGMTAMMVLGSSVVIFAAMVLFGAGFGVIETPRSRC